MSIQDRIRERIEAALARHRRGEPVSPVGEDEDSGVEFRDLPTSVLVTVRSAFVECTECFSPVLRGSTAEHAEAHLRAAQEMVGPGPTSGAFVAPRLVADE